MIAKNNMASQFLFEKNGFKIISKWAYYAKRYKSRPPKRNQKQGLQLKKILIISWITLENRRFTDYLENDISTLGDGTDWIIEDW